MYKFVFIFYLTQIFYYSVIIKMDAKKRICVLGSANVDSFVYVKHIPVPGETIQAEKYMIANGGKGANQAAAVGKLAGSCVFTGQVGVDDEMRNLEKQMTSCNVELLWKKIPEVPTGKAFIYVEDSGENSIVIVGGANTYYNDFSSLPEEYMQAIDKCDCVQLQKQVPTELNALAAKYAKSKGKTVILDCGGRDDLIGPELLNNLDYISPNETELLRIDPDVDINNPVEEIRTKIMSKYKNLKFILKLGGKGSAVITDSLYIHVPVVTAINEKTKEDFKIIDTVGAGDCFTSAFTVKLLEQNAGENSDWSEVYRKALLFGNSSAFLCITKKGAMPSMPSREAVDKLQADYNLQ